MSWFRPQPSPEKVAVDQAVEEACAARDKRRKAMQALMRALDEIPLDDGLVQVGKDMTRVPEGGH